MRRLLLAAVLLSAPLGAPALSAQAPRLSLAEAFREADRMAFPNRGAAGRAAEQAGNATSALRGVAPTLRVQTSYTRTTDPLGVFGMRLQEGVVTGADFDPARLNDPAATGNYGAAVIVEQPIVNVDALFGRRAAARARDAARASEQWTRESTRVDVVRAYYGAVLAEERVAALDTAARAARAHVAQAEAMLRNGLATRSDALLAQVSAGDVEAQLAAARADVGLAYQQLALTIGRPADTAFTLPDHLPRDEQLVAAARTALAPDASDPPRADVQAATLALEAAHADRQRARAQLLPRIASFGRIDWSAASQPWGGNRSWTAGVMLSWVPFAGGSVLGDQRAAAGREAAARAAADGAQARAALEVTAAERHLRVALTRLEIARRSEEQATEAHRIVSRKYDGGLATVAELLDAAGAEMRTRLGRSSAQYETLIAIAERRQALGLTLEPLAALDQ